jgi:hypothetical protein
MSNMTLPDSFCIRYKKRPLDFDRCEYKLVRGWWREYQNIRYRKLPLDAPYYRYILNREFIWNENNIYRNTSDLELLNSLLDGNKALALLNLQNKKIMGIYQFLCKEIIVNQNTFKLIKI